MVQGHAEGLRSKFKFRPKNISQVYNITYPANRSFFLTWVLAFTKSFASFALTLW